MKTLFSLKSSLSACAGATLLLTGLSSTSFSQHFTNVTAEAGIIQIEARAWGNPIWGDINNDGYLDLIVPVHELDYLGGPLTPFVYINNQDGTFTEKGVASGLNGNAPDDNKDWLSCAFGDYDNDGNLDFLTVEPPFQSGGGDDGNGILISEVPARNPLYKGNGDGTFTYVSVAAGLELGRNYGGTGFFVDYDNDGFLDIFVKNQSTSQETSVNVLYHNDGDGTFTIVPDAGGLADANRGLTEGTHCSFADYDNDGYMDAVFGGNGAADALYRNQGDGTFVEVTVAAGITPRVNALGFAWGDYDNDGLLDLYISRGKQSGLGDLGNTLYRNNGNGTFTEVANAAGVNDNTNTWAALWGDYDNDGYLDLFVVRTGTSAIGVGNANILYHNNGDGTFTDKAAEEGVDLQDDDLNSAHKLAAWGDYNNDGFLDLVVQDGIAPTKVTGEAATGFHYLFKNNGNGNHFIKLKLRGVESNLDGIGARVTVTYDGGKVFRLNNGGGGGEYASQGSGPLHFGIGAATVATIQINWPSGIVDILRSVAADSDLTVIEGSNPPTTESQNISTRLDVGTGTSVGIGGFIVTGLDAKEVLVRGLGPSLSAFGVPGVLANPVLELHLLDGTTVQNDNWRDSQADQITATGLAPTDDAEAAIIMTLEPGPYTAVLSGNNGTGVGLIEVYALNPASDSHLANVSTRGFVGTGDDVLIGGIIVGPEGAPAATLVVRAIGPTLAGQGIAESLADPTLELYDNNGTLIASNDDWQDDPVQADTIDTLGLAPGDSRESGIHAIAPTGSYTAIVRGSSETTGVGLVEIYNIQ